MLLLLEQITFFLVLAANLVGSDVPIAQLASEALAAELEASSNVKEWVLDFAADIEDLRSSFVDRKRPINCQQLMKEILVDDGHDIGSNFDDVWIPKNAGARCGCCASMKSNMQTNSPSFISKRYNNLVNTVCERMANDFKSSGLDPMPLLLRKRSVKETAFLLQAHPYFKRSLSSNSSDAESTDQEGKGHYESNQDAPPSRVFAILSGLSTLRRNGEFQTMMLPNGRTMIKVNMLAGPLQLNIPSAISNNVTLQALRQDDPSSHFIAVDEVEAEMHLVLHPRHGLLLHSFRFAQPTKFSTNRPSNFAQSIRIPFRGSAIPVISNANEAAVAQQVRHAIRETLYSS